MRNFSYGGGVQSTAVLVLVKRGDLDYENLLFCNVGKDSEHPDTLNYFNKIARPFAQRNGIELKELRKYRFGEIETVYERAMSDKRTIPIPVKMNTGAPGRRSCTADFKIRVIAKWQKENGATKENPAISVPICEFNSTVSMKTEEPCRISSSITLICTRSSVNASVT